MASTAYPVQTDFSAGEVSSGNYWRLHDPENYARGLSAMANYWAHPEGGMVRRPGTLFVAPCKYRNKTTRIEGIQFEPGVKTVVEFGHLYVRIYEDDVLVDELSSPYRQTEVMDIDFAQFGSLVYIAHENHPTQLLAREDGDYSMERVNLLDGPYLRSESDVTWSVSGYTDRMTLVSSFEDEFNGLELGDIIEFEHLGVLRIGEVVDDADEPHDRIIVRPIDNIVSINNLTAPVFRKPSEDIIYSMEAQFSQRLVGSWIKLSTTDADPDEAPTWAHIHLHRGITTVQKNDYPDVTDEEQGANVQVDMMEADEFIQVSRWVRGNTGEPGYIGQVSALDRTVTAVLVANDEHLIDPETASNRAIRFNFDGIQFWGEISAIVDDHTIQITTDQGMPLNPENQAELMNAGKTVSYRLGAFFEGNYPRKVAFHEQRLFFAGTRINPQTFWASVIGDFELFAPTERDSSVTDSNGFSYDISTKRQSPIQWMVSSRVLIMGMIDGEAVVRGTTINETLTPNTVRVVVETKIGSTNVAPAQLGNSVFFVNGPNDTFHEYYYNNEIEAYIGVSLNRLNESVVSDGGGFRQLSATNSPWPMVFAVRNDGQLAAITRPTLSPVYPWHRTLLGGVYDNQRQYGVVESVTTAISANEDDEVYVVVTRIGIDGVEKKYIEKFSPIQKSRHPLDLRNLVYTDSSIRYRETNDNLIADNVEGAAAHLTFITQGTRYGIALVSNGEVIRDALDGVGFLIDTDGNIVTDFAFLDDGVDETELVFGINYMSLAATLNPSLMLERGPSHLMIKRIDRVLAYVSQSEFLAIAMGHKKDEVAQSTEAHFTFFRLHAIETDRETDSPRVLESKLETVGMNHEHKDDVRVFLIEERPIPQKILGAGLRMSVQSI